MVHVGKIYKTTNTFSFGVHISLTTVGSEVLMMNCAPETWSPATRSAVTQPEKTVLATRGDAIRRNVNHFGY